MVWRYSYCISMSLLCFGVCVLPPRKERLVYVGISIENIIPPQVSYIALPLASILLPFSCQKCAHVGVEGS